MDMSESIAPKSDQMNAEDLLGGPRTFTITEVRAGSGAEQPFWFYLAEFPKDRPFKPSKTVRRIIVVGWGPDTDAYIGKRFTLYRDDAVKWAGKEIGGIRVSHMSGIGRKALSVMLPPSRGRRDPYTVEPLSDNAPAAKAPGPLDQLVWAFNTAQIMEAADRLAYCRDVVQRDLVSAADLTPDEVDAVIDALTRKGAEDV